MSLAVNTHSLSLNIPNNVNNNQAKLSTASSETAALTTILDAAPDDTIRVSSTALGAYQNTFAPSITSLQSSVESMAATLARIRNEGFAQQSANLLRTQFTQYPLTAMLAQANQSPQEVLVLLR